jgi:hypothetical protein
MRGPLHVSAARLLPDPHSGTRVDALLAIKRDVIKILCDEDVDDEAHANTGLWDHLRRQGRHDRCVGPLRAGIHRSHDLQPEELTGLILDLLGDLLADLHQACFLCFGQIDYFAPHR